MLVAKSFQQFKVECFFKQGAGFYSVQYSDFEGELKQSKFAYDQHFLMKEFKLDIQMFNDMVR